MPYDFNNEVTFQSLYNQGNRFNQKINLKRLLQLLCFNPFITRVIVSTLWETGLEIAISMFQSLYNQGNRFNRKAYFLYELTTS